MIVYFIIVYFVLKGISYTAAGSHSLKESGENPTAGKEVIEKVGCPQDIQEYGD
jgi:hypothetical protein